MANCRVRRDRVRGPSYQAVRRRWSEATSSVLLTVQSYVRPSYRMMLPSYKTIRSR